MSTPTEQLTAQGVSIWLDDLSRERITSGNLAELIDDPQRERRDDEPDDLRRRAVEGPRRTRRRSRSSPPRARPPTTRSSRSRPTTCATRRTSSVRSTTPRTASTAACRSRSPPTSRTTPPRRSIRPSSCGRRSTARTRTSRSPRPKAGLPAITATLAEGISVNVTLIFSLERYAEVIDAYLVRHRAGAGRGPRHLEDPLGRVVLRVARRHRGRQAPDRDRHRRGRGAQVARPASRTRASRTSCSSRSSPPTAPRR